MIKDIFGYISGRVRRQKGEIFGFARHQNQSQIDLVITTVFVMVVPGATAASTAAGGPRRG